MKKLQIEQMEQTNGGGWGSVACHIGFIGVGAMIGGPYGGVIGHVAALSLCHSTPAY